MFEKYIWQPISFNSKWNDVNTQKFDNISPSWERKKAELNKEPEQYKKFIDQLKRKQAIDTGIIEQMYDLKRGITETFIREGFVDSYLGHGDTDIAPNLLMGYLRDNFSAIDGIFDFVKSDRNLSVSYIKELHAIIMQHQEKTDAIDSLGNNVRIPLLKGQFKRHPNNPVRDGVVYSYCPPEQVASEMDNLVRIFNTDLPQAHALVKAAYVHHAFVQIHPFQDGNGRIARLLASFVLIKDGLFPFSIDRGERNKYIDALEFADQGEFQPLVDIIAENQIESIERALNWRTAIDIAGYDGVVSALEKKLYDYQNAEAADKQRKKQINENMRVIYIEIKNQMEIYRKDLLNRLSNMLNIHYKDCDTEDTLENSFKNQIEEYARLHNYHANLSLGTRWGYFEIEINKSTTYRMLISLHLYGYDDSAFAVGAVLTKIVSHKYGNKKDYSDIPLGLPPLIMSSEKDVEQLKSSIAQHVELQIMSVLAYIVNELG